MKDLKDMKQGDIFQNGIIYSKFDEYQYVRQTGKKVITFEDMECILKESEAKGEHVYLNASCGPLFSTDNLTAEDICMKIFGRTLEEQKEFQKSYLKNLEECRKSLKKNPEKFQELFGEECDKPDRFGKLFRKKEDTYFS